MKVASAALAFLVSAVPALAFCPANHGTFGTRKRWALASTTEKMTSSLVSNSTNIATLLESANNVDAKEQTKPPPPPPPPVFAHTGDEVRSFATSYLEQYQGKTGAHIVYSKLQENGVSVVNGYSGGAVLPLLDQFHEDNPRHRESNAPRIRWITNSNEANAGHVTEGIAKALPLGGEHLPVGVCIATSGPGVTNLITPLQDAICDGVPMVVMCGQAASTAPPDAFQSAPAVEMTRPCTKWSYQIKSAAEIPFVFDYAFFVARNGRPGPVFVDLPKDLQNQVLSDDLIGDFVNHSLADDSADEFARLAPINGPSGPSIALHFGEVGQGLTFEIEEKSGGGLKVNHVLTAGEQGRFETDHAPTNTIHKFSPAGESEKVEALEEESKALGEIIKLVRRAKKPILLAGQGCNECPDELKKLAETLQIPTTTTLHALGTFDERSPLALNMLGMHGHPTPNFMIQESDLVLCVGSRFDDRITGRMSDFIPIARQAAEEGRGGVIHVDIRLTEKSKQLTPTYFVHSTARQFLRVINRALDGVSSKGNTEWLERMRFLKREFPVGIPRFRTVSVDSIDRTPMSAQLVIQEMNKQLVDSGRIDDSIFTTGVGIHQMVAAQLITWTQPRQMLSSGSLGTMGVSTGYATGAKLARPGKMVISVDGDGSFNMSFTELKTIAEQKIPVRILILDNESQMMVEYWQRLFHEKRYLAVRNNNPDYTTLASAFGIGSLHCDCEEDLPQKMSEFLNWDPEEPVLFHVRIKRTPCLPLVAPGQRLENMILVDEDFEVDPSAAPS